MKTEKTESGTLETWTPEEVSDALEVGRIVLIDVRTPMEFAQERVEGALLSPMSHFRPDRLPTEGDKRLVFHCAGGKRSERVARAYLDAGHDRVAHMGGGFGAWKEAHLPYIGTDMATGAPSRENQ